MIVLINNRNLLTWPKEMVSCISQFQGLSEIIILDNDSSYPPLLDWYAERPCKIIFTGQNNGHFAPFQDHITSQMTELFVISDPDMGLLEVPKDVLLKMKDYIEHCPVDKVGLSLNYQIVSPLSPYYTHVNSWEKQFYETPVIHKGIRASGVDTTFAMYSKKKKTTYFVGGCRMDPPYTARHYPWEIITPDEEFIYYLQRVNASSSYASFWRHEWDHLLKEPI